MLKNLTDTVEIWTKLLQCGLMFEPFAGIQIDLNVVFKKLPDGRITQSSLCDHNCTDKVGGYNCNAAMSYAKGSIPEFARAAQIIQWLTIARSGLIQARDRFLAQEFQSYCEDFLIPDNIAAVLREMLSQDIVEVNLFGGNPEMHKDILWIIQQLKVLGFRINFTTTGRKFLKDDKFVEGFIQNPAHLVAVSADDVKSLEQLEKVLAMDIDGIRAEWEKTERDHGQDQKFYEGIGTALIASQVKGFAPILFNMVLHPDNLSYALTMMQAIQERFPNAIVNPYPAQTSFEGKPSPYRRKDIERFEELVDYLIGENLAGNHHFTRRVHYYLLQKASLEANRDNFRVMSDGVAGNNLWKCYQRPGSGFYLQIGKAPDNQFFQITRNKNNEGKAPFDVENSTFNAFSGDPGGHLTCYWENSSVSQFRQVESVQQVRNYVMGGMTRLAAKESSKCLTGCSMPRLWFNMVNMELGMNPDLWPTYLKLRQKHLGF